MSGPRSWLLRLLLITGFIQVACSRVEPPPTSTAAPEEPAPVQSSSIPAEPATLAAEVKTYNLGETSLLQDHFPIDSRFREMPVRLEGIVGAPQGPGTFPVVLIMHGSHIICPGEDVWPCSAEEEQTNYAGFSYLVEALAEAGYVALSINVNAEHTFAYGEAPPGVRTKQLINAHLGELSAAAAGESDKFGLNLTDRVDLSQMVWIGHSRGGDLANRIIREESLQDSAGATGYGPVRGLILLAPPIVSTDVLPAADVTTALILPACDWDVALLSGQSLYESARFDPDRQNLITSVYLEHGNHANFNTILEPDPIIDDRPDCAAEQVLAPEAQQAFLAQYVVDFLASVFAQPGQSDPYPQRLGLDPRHPMPTELDGTSIQVTTLQPAAKRLTVLQPLSEDEFSRNLLGGDVVLRGINGVFCLGGYQVPEPGTEACQRVNSNQPGYPQQLALNWNASDAEWRTALPASSADLTAYAALSLRAVLDPLSERNTEGESLSFSVELVDQSGRRAEVRGLELAYPPGERRANEYFEGDMFTGHVTLHALQIPLEQLAGIDLANVTEIALLFDQSPSGALFLADLALLKGDTLLE